MKRVLITGASSGIGAAAAKAFHRQGAQVILVARTADKINALRDALGVTAVALPCDASDGDAVLAMATKVLEEVGAPDVIVHCAGAGQWKTVQDTTPTEAVEMMKAPYFTAFNVTHAFLPAMLERNSGVILHVNSPGSVVPWPSSVGYTAARAALRGFHEALSQDLAGTELHSCHVIFGKVSSEYFDNNPGVIDKMPGLTATIPTLTVERCAEALTHVAHYPQHEAIYPFILRPYILFGRVFPRPTRWMLRF